MTRSTASPSRSRPSARQRELDVQAWRNRLEKIGTELAEQPARIEACYVVNARRLEPVGLIYLWPATG